HDVCRAEEMQAEHVRWPTRHRSKCIDIEIGRVGGKDRAAFEDGVELSKHRLFDCHILEYGLDHQIGLRKLLEIECGPKLAKTLFGFLRCHAPALDAPVI